MGAHNIVIPYTFFGSKVSVDELNLNNVNVLKNIIDPKNNRDFALPYHYYTAAYDRYNPAFLDFMDKEERKQLYFDLRIAYLLLMAKQQQELAYQKQENVEIFDKKLKACKSAIYRLEKKSENKQVILESPQDCPVNYVLMRIGQWFGEKIHEAINAKTKCVQHWLGEINEKRLYWCWGGGLLAAVLNQEMVSHQFSHAADARKEVTAPSPVTGYLSFILYYFRFGLNLFLLLKHTIRHPWMDKEESDIPWTERFQTQWQQRKFSLINDFVWATANMVGFFWLVGSAVKNNANNMLTLGLLVLDLTLSIWRYWEAETEYRKQRSILKENKEKVDEDIAAAMNAYEKAKADYEKMESGEAGSVAGASKEYYKSEMDKAEKLKKQLMRQQLNLTQDIAQLEADWKFKKMGMINGIAYSLGLMVFFSLLAAAYFVAPLAIVGIAGCFVLTVLYSAINAGFEIHKARKGRKEAALEIQRLKEKLPEAKDENHKKQIYLQIKDLQAKSEHETKVLRYQSLSLVRSLMIDAMMPAIIFAATVFMPLGIGIAVIGAALAVALISKLLLNIFAQPKEDELVKAEFDQEGYEKFCRENLSVEPSEKNQSSSSETETPDYDADSTCPKTL